MNEKTGGSRKSTEGAATDRRRCFVIFLSFCTTFLRIIFLFLNYIAPNSFIYVINLLPLARIRFRLNATFTSAMPTQTHKRGANARFSFKKYKKKKILQRGEKVV